MTRTLDRESISTKQQKIATLAREAPQMVLLTLAHHIDRMWLEEAYRRLALATARWEWTA